LEGTDGLPQNGEGDGDAYAEVVDGTPRLPAIHVNWQQATKAFLSNYIW